MWIQLHIIYSSTADVNDYLKRVNMNEFVNVRAAFEQAGRTEAKIRSLIQQGKIRVERIGYYILMPYTELRKLRSETKGA